MGTQLQIRNHWLTTIRGMRVCINVPCLCKEIEAHRSCSSNSSVSIVHFLPAAIVDSVEENLQASRCLLLLYNASTFYNKGHTSTISNNNNISKTSDGSDKTESKPEDCSMSMSFDCQVSSNPRQQLEVVAAMHRALLESSLKVRRFMTDCRT